MLGEYPGTPPLPSFWSDQYGLRIQYVGHAHHADAVVVEGDPAERDFEAVFTRGGVPVAGLTVGRPRAIPALQQAHRRAATVPRQDRGGGSMTYIPMVDPNECSAHGDCVEIAPEVFRLDDDARS